MLEGRFANRLGEAVGIILEERFLKETTLEGFVDFETRVVGGGLGVHRLRASGDPGLIGKAGLSAVLIGDLLSCWLRRSC